MSTVNQVLSFAVNNAVGAAVARVDGTTRQSKIALHPENLAVLADGLA